MLDPDFEIRGGVGGGGGGSVSKKFFSSLVPKFGLKTGGGSPGPRHWQAVSFFLFKVTSCVVVCSHAGWDKKWTDYKRKGGLQEV